MLINQWQYQLEVQVDNEGNSVVINSAIAPLKIHFNIEKRADGTPSDLRLDIYNLSPNTRNQILEDRFLMQDDTTILANSSQSNIINASDYRRVLLSFKNGKKAWNVEFIGNLVQTSTYKDDVGNVITSIYAQDGSYAMTNSFSALAIQSDITLAELFYALADNLHFTDVGEFNISNGDAVLSGGVSIYGNTWSVLKKYSDYQCFIQNEKLFIQSTNGFFIGSVPVISAETGLLRLPAFTKTTTTVETLFSPSYQVGQFVELITVQNARQSGAYKIFQINHEGEMGEGGDMNAKSFFLLQKGEYGNLNPTTV